MSITNQNSSFNQSSSALDEASKVLYKRILQFMSDIAIACLVIFALSLATSLGWIKD